MDAELVTTRSPVACRVVGILTSLLPGVRELRAPLVAGLIWFSALYMILAPHVGSLVDISAINSLWEAARPAESLIIPALIVGGSYIIGTISQSLFRPVVRLAGRVVRRSLSKFTRHFHFLRRHSERGYPIPRRPRWLFKWLGAFEVETWPLKSDDRGLILNSTSTALSKVGVPGSASLLIPHDVIIASLPGSAVQLSVTAPNQYQEFDRLRAEVELREAIIPPLLFISTVVPLVITWPALVGATLISGMILYQAAVSTRQAHTLLVSCVYYGYIQPPLVQSLAAEISGVDPKPQNDAEWIGLLAVSFFKVGHFGESETVIREAMSEDHAEQRSQVRSYIVERIPSMAEFFDRVYPDDDQSGDSDDRHAAD